MKYKLVIFDLDGTILDTLDDLTASLNYALASTGNPVRTRDEVRRFLGNGIRRLTELGAPDGASSEVVDSIFEKFNMHYAAHCSDRTAPYGGISGAVSALRGAGIVTAVVSNKADYATQELCEKYFHGLFDFVSGAKDGVRKKPCPDLINQVIRNFGADINSTAYVGDSEVDIQAAKNAGIPCISVDWGFRSRAELISSGAGTIISHPNELLRLCL